MNVEYYTGVDGRLELPVVLPPTLDVVDLRGMKVMVADDVAVRGDLRLRLEADRRLDQLPVVDLPPVVSRAGSGH
jgi:hypothetical protein